MQSLVKRYSGLVGSFNNSDYYAFTVIGTQVITLDLNANYGSPDVLLYAADGSSIGSDYVSTSGSATSDATLVETLGPGTYYAAVNNTSSSPYTLSIYTGLPTTGDGSTDAGGNSLAAATSLGTLTSTATTIADYIGGQDVADYYAFSVGSTSNVSVDLNGLQNGAYLYLLNAAGNQIAGFNSSGGEIKFNDILPTLVAGKYYIKIVPSSTSYPTGYNLSVAATAIPDLAGNSIATAHTIGTLSGAAQSFTDSVNVGDTSDYYSFNVAQNSQVSLSLSGVTANASFTLYDASGNTVLNASDATPSHNGSITVNLAPLSTGSYYIGIANNYDSTNYTLTASAVALQSGNNAAITSAASIAPSTAPQSVIGYIDPAVAQTDYYKITLTSQTVVNLRLNGLTNGDVISPLELSLLGSGGSTIAGTYATQSSGDGLISENLAAGTYYAKVTQDGSATPFTLTYSTGSPAVGSPTVDNAGNTMAVARDIGTLSGTVGNYVDWVGTSDTQDFYKFTLSTASNIFFDATGLTNYANMTLVDVSGNVKASSYGGSVSGPSITQALAAGTYFINIADTNNAGTAYHLAAYATALPNVGGISLGTADNLGMLTAASQTIAGFVGPMDNVDYFEFQLAVPSTINAALSGLSAGTNVNLLDISGNLISSTYGYSSSSASLIKNLAAGTYFLQVDGTNPTNYSMSVNATPIADSAGYSLGSAYDVGSIGSQPTEDFSGSGYSDILFRNNTTGDMGWYIPPTSTAAAGWKEFGATSSAYTIVGVGDFNGDGTADILFRDNANGSTGYIANHANGTAASWYGFGTTSTAYSIAAVGDFNGDGTSDILFRNNATGDAGIYLLSASGANTWQGLGTTSLLYSTVGVGDFVGDGKQQILFENMSNGNTGFYELGSNGNPGSWTNVFNANTAYSVVGTGDFNGDGITDILYRNSSTGDMGYLAMGKGGTSFTWAGFGGTSTAWSVVGTGDYTGNGVSDILFRNNTTGDTGYLAPGINGASNTWYELGVTSTAYSIISSPTYG